MQSQEIKNKTAPSQNEKGQSFDYVHELISLNRIFNTIGIIGTIMNIWYFIDTLFQLRSGEISAGLYFQSFIIVFFFLVFISVAKFKLDDDGLFVILMSSAYGVALTLILIATYYITCEVVLKFGSDFLVLNPTGTKMNSFDFFSSRSALAIFMFVSAYFAAGYFVLRSHKIVGKLATLPIFVLFVWVASFLIGGGRILDEFSNGFKDELVFGYVTITLMTIALVAFASTILKKSAI